MALQSSHLPDELPLETLFTQLQQQSWFCQLQAQLTQRQQLQQLFDQECPLELIGQCRVLGLKDHCLQIELANAGGATQLQFRTRELLAALRKYPVFSGLKKIHSQIARVTLSSNNHNNKLLSTLVFSTETIAMFKQLADKLTDDELKVALLKLIGR